MNSTFETIRNIAIDLNLDNGNGFLDWDLNEDLGWQNETLTLTREDGEMLVFGLEYDEDGEPDGWTASAYSNQEMLDEQEPGWTDGSENLDQDTLADCITRWAKN